MKITHDTRGTVTITITYQTQSNVAVVRHTVQDATINEVSDALYKHRHDCILNSGTDAGTPITIRIPRSVLDNNVVELEMKS